MNGSGSRRRLHGLVIALAILGAVSPAMARTKVACIGASTTQGSGAPAGQSYPDQLAKLLGDQYEVRNFGKSGAGALKKGDPTYWNSAEYNAATAYAPDIVINWLGGADSKAASWDPHKAEFLDDYKGMIAHFQDLPTHPLVISMMSIALHDDAGVRKTVLEGEVNPLQRRGAMERGSPFVDTKAVVDGHPEYFADGVHLKAIGYAAVARAAQAMLLASLPGDGGVDAIVDAGAADTAVPMVDAASPVSGDVAVAPAAPPDAAARTPRTADAAPATPDPQPEPPAGGKSSAAAGGCAVSGGRASWAALVGMLAAIAWLARRRRSHGA